MITVVVDDLAFLAVDAIVRPATDHLDPVTPAMARLDQQAGPRFARERQVQQPLEAGAAVVTAAGDLPATFVIHTIIQGGATQPGREVIRRALLSAWQRAAAWELRALATPLVGHGPGQLSLEESVGLLTQTCREHRSGSTFPESVIIVVETEAERAAVLPLLEGSPS